MIRIATGAEAELYKEDGVIIKDRVKKRYRIRELDEALRISRNAREFAIMKRCHESGIDTPRPIKLDIKGRIYMENIAGYPLSSKFSSKNMGKVADMLWRLHSLGIVHGDPTTANMLVSRGRVFLIDFGLSFYSKRAEDRASDLFLLKKALASKHPEQAKIAYKKFISRYKKNSGKEFKPILSHLRDMETRRRYYESY
ncbi:Kae1-associated serine/threonine protein kinase [Candidatus Parvarchaeota archaeon]|nr:Kae1-associated serine/threonine protein kinase [Candidatus Parvarchaeota archaeon]